MPIKAALAVFLLFPIDAGFAQAPSASPSPVNEQAEMQAAASSTLSPGGEQPAGEKATPADYQVEAGEEFTFSLAGELWTYVGQVDAGTEKMNLEFKRNLQPRQTAFTVLFPKMGRYQVEFSRQDATQGSSQRRFLTFEAVASAADALPAQEPAATSVATSLVAAAGKSSAASAAAGEQSAIVQPENMAAADEVAASGAAGPGLSAAQLRLRLKLRLVDVSEQNRQHLQQGFEQLVEQHASELESWLAQGIGVAELMFKFAQRLEQAGPEQNFALAYQLYHRLSEDYPAHRLAATAGQAAEVLDRNFISVY